jgi:cell division protein FtsL
MLLSKFRYSIATFFLLVTCLVLSVLLMVVQSNHHARQRTLELEIHELREQLEQMREEEIKLKMFALQQMRTALTDRNQLPIWSSTGGKLASELLPHYPMDEYLWWVLLTTKVLADGIELEEAKRILGEPTKFTTDPAYGKPPYYEWHGSGKKLAADFVDGRFKFWRLQTTAIGGY